MKQETVLAKSAVAAAVFVWAASSAALAGPLPAATFAYRQGPVVLREGGPQRTVSGITVRDVSFASPSGGRQIRARLYSPRTSRPHGAVLFVHWLGDSQTTNLTEFSSDATELARRGCTSLAIDAMWAQRDWFERVRKPETDYDASIRQVVDLRRSLDVLLAQPHVDPERLVYVGHDFGAMYGGVLSGIDARPKYYVLMAGTTSFSRWYLLGAKPNDVAAYVARMKPLDPLPYLRASRAHGFLFQFAAKDAYVTRAQATSFFAASPLPSGLFFYRADHALRDPLVYIDRLTWIGTRAGCQPARLTNQG
jgi:hypothetical protein